MFQMSSLKGCCKDNAYYKTYIDNYKFDIILWFDNVYLDDPIQYLYSFNGWYWYEWERFTQITQIL